MKLGVIADDFTGATDIAGFLGRTVSPPCNSPVCRSMTGICPRSMPW